MYEEFVEQQQTSVKQVGDLSLELMDADGRDEGRESLERIREELDREQQKFTEAATKSKNEKATLEVRMCHYNSALR